MPGSGVKRKFMAHVFLSLGSNIDRHRHICSALDALAELFGELAVSSIYESEAVGFDGDHFYNLVVGIETTLSVGELSRSLKRVEDENGRRRDCPRFSARTLDIDILTYDQSAGVIDGITLPRPEILENAFVLLPLAELAPDEAHPQASCSYSELWKRYAGREASQQKLWPVDFSWRGEQISRAS